MKHDNQLFDKILKLVYPKIADPQKNLEQFEKKYPARDLPKNAFVVRVAPSPTGFAHLGYIYMSIVTESIANTTGGVSILRIEDTDQEREVPGARELLVEVLKSYDIKLQEGPFGQDYQDVGNYGPYSQSQRKEIYLTCAKKLLETGHAYVCFATSKELDEIRETQQKQKVPPGYYGNWAIWRNKPQQEVIEKLEKGEPFVLRFKSKPESENIETKKFKDIIRGEISISPNTEDFVLIKSNGLPTYHFAHIVDEHFMRVNLVIRGNEWIPSLPKHLDLWESMGFEAPIYGHLSLLEKTAISDDGKLIRRKISKRYDPEANVMYFLQNGIPAQALKAYLTNILSSGYEDEAKAKEVVYIENYPLTPEKLKTSGGALFDMKKLLDVSQQYIAQFTSEQLLELFLVWAKQYDSEFYKIASNDLEFTKKVLNIEHTADKSRKDISQWSDVKTKLGFFFDEIYTQAILDWTGLDHIPAKKRIQVSHEFLHTFKISDPKDIWLEKIKKVAIGAVFAPDKKTYESNHGIFNGYWGDVPAILRVIITTTNKSPDLYQTMQILGKQKVVDRIKKYITFLGGEIR